MRLILSNVSASICFFLSRTRVVQSSSPRKALQRKKNRLSIVQMYTKKQVYFVNSLYIFILKLTASRETVEERLFCDTSENRDGDLFGKKQSRRTVNSGAMWQSPGDRRGLLEVRPRPGSRCAFLRDVVSLANDGRCIKRRGARESSESVYYLFFLSVPFLSLSLWHCSGHVISYALWRQWCLQQFLNIFVKFFVQKKTIKTT